MNHRTNYVFLAVLVVLAGTLSYTFSFTVATLGFIPPSPSYLTAQAASSLTQGLVAHYTFDEGSGTTAADSAGSNTATLTNGPTWTTGKVGSGALQLDGSNDYVLTPRLQSGSSPVSISAWIRTDATGKSYNNGAGILSNLNNDASGDFFLGVTSAYSITFYYNKTGGNDPTGENETGINVVSKDTWAHVVGVWDGATAKIYVNGVSKSTTQNSWGDWGTEHSLGRLAGLSLYTYKGDLDDVRVYNRQLSDQEVQDLYALGSGGTPSSPTVINGSCSATLNSCSAGTFSDSTDTVSNALWTCVGSGGGSTASCSAALSNPTNQPPVVSAGASQTITLPSSATIQATVSDDGLPIGGGLTTTWSTVSGPGTVSFSNPSGLSTTASFSQAGTYTLRISATDTVLTTTSDVVVTVNQLAPSPTVSPLPVTGIIPSDRRIDWTNAGIPGGIPGRTTVCANVKSAPYNAVGNGIVDDTAAIAAAIAACPAGQVVYMPAGTYKAGITLNKGVVLRGDGAKKTTVNGAIYLHKGFAINSKTAITSGWERGSDAMDLADASYIKVGDHLLIEAGDNPGIVNRQGYEGTPAAPTRGQIVEVTAMAGKKITFKPPLYWELSAVNYAPTAKILTRAGAGYENYLQRAGVESLTLVHDPAFGFFNNALTLQNCAYCWVKNVEIDQSARAAIQLTSVYRSEISHNYLHHTTMTGSGGGYGIVVENKSTDNLFSDNALDYHSGSILIDDSIGNVVSYNYIGNTKYRTVNWLQATIGSHSTHPMMNLFEGNVGSVFRSDFIHGSASHFTIFRNRFTGWESDAVNQNNSAITIHSWNRYFNVVGNVLGTAGKSTNYSLVSANFNTWNIYWLGYAGALPVDDLTTSSLLRHGNYDFVTNSTIWDPAITDHTLPTSLYLSAAPSWFGSTPWPPIGPDVAGLSNKIPAQICFERGEMPGCLTSGGGGGTPLFPLINGRCSNVVHTCASGVFMDITDTATDFVWQCLGSNGGTRAACDIPQSNTSPDTAAPIISNVTSAGATASTVLISWKTNEIAHTQVQYGLSTAYEAGSSFNSTLSTNHSALLTGLLPGTLYHFKVISVDGVGNSTSSSDFTFSTSGGSSAPTSVAGICSPTLNSCTAGIFSDTADSASQYLWSCLGSNGGATASCSLARTDTTTPDTTAPVTSGILASSLTSSGATITWNTNEGATTQVEYGLTTAYGNKTALNSSYTTSHTQTLTNLSANTLYHYRVLSIDQAGNATVSTDQTFATASVTVVPPTTTGGSGATGGTPAGGGGAAPSTPSTPTTPSAPSAPSIPNTPSTPSIPSTTPLTPVSTTPIITRPRTVGERNQEVKQLQTFLNNQGFTVAVSGPGSKGQETDYFGPATVKALSLFQATNNLPQGSLNQATIDRINTLAKVYSGGSTATPTPTTKPTTTKYTFTRTLKLGQTGTDVKQLQIFLNNQGFTISTSGAGSKGNESTYFGPATYKALMKFQLANRKTILDPYGYTIATGFFGPATLKVVNQMGR